MWLKKNTQQEGKKSSSRALFFWHSMVLTKGPLGTWPPSNLSMIYVLRDPQSLSLHLDCLEALGRRILCKNTGAGAHVPNHWCARVLIPFFTRANALSDLFVANPVASACFVPTRRKNKKAEHWNQMQDCDSTQGRNDTDENLQATRLWFPVVFHEGRDEATSQVRLAREENVFTTKFDSGVYFRR